MWNFNVLASSLSLKLRPSLSQIYWQWTSVENMMIYRWFCGVELRVFMLLLGSLSLEIKWNQFYCVAQNWNWSWSRVYFDNSFLVQSLPFFVYNVLPRNTPSTYNSSLLCAHYIYLLCILICMIFTCHWRYKPQILTQLSSILIDTIHVPNEMACLQHVINCVWYVKAGYWIKRQAGTLFK